MSLTGMFEVDAFTPYPIFLFQHIQDLMSVLVGFCKSFAKLEFCKTVCVFNIIIFEIMDSYLQTTSSKVQCIVVNVWKLEGGKESTSL